MVLLELLPTSNLLVSNEARHRLLSDIRSAIEHESANIDEQISNTVVQRFDVHRMLGLATDSTMRNLRSQGLSAESEELTSDALVHNSGMLVVFVACVAVCFTLGLLSQAVFKSASSRRQARQPKSAAAEGLLRS